MALSEYPVACAIDSGERLPSQAFNSIGNGTTLTLTGASKKTGSLPALVECESNPALAQEVFLSCHSGPNHGPVSPFGDLLDRLLKRSGLTGRGFDRLIGSGNGFVNQVIRGEAPPPRERLDAWADALSLSGAERAGFIALGKRAKIDAKSDIRADTDALYARVAIMQGVLAELGQALADHSEHLPEDYVRRVEEILSRSPRQE